MFDDLNTVGGTEHDIALIKTSHTIATTDYVNPINLSVQHNITIGLKCVAAGWGETINGSGMYMHAYNLTAVIYIKIVSINKCCNPKTS